MKRPALKTDTVNIYRSYGSLYTSAANQLKKDHRLAEGWLTTAGIYPKDGEPKGAGIQFFRSNWLNKEGNGIHFESWMKKSYHEEGHTPFVLHIEVGRERAGFGQKDFSKIFLKQFGGKLQAMGYSLNPNYAMEPIKVFRKTSKESFESIVVEEFVRLSPFAEGIDKLIGELKNS